MLANYHQGRLLGSYRIRQHVVPRMFRDHERSVVHPAAAERSYERQPTLACRFMSPDMYLLIWVPVLRCLGIRKYRVS